MDLGANNNITVRFQTREAQGTILYADQGVYVFSCNREEGIRRINTSI
ncbi:unnamed protein product, partial [Coregonus sp. 'balchen']